MVSYKFYINRLILGRGRGRGGAEKNPNSLEFKLQFALSHSDDPALIAQRNRFTTPILYPVYILINNVIILGN